MKIRIGMLRQTNRMDITELSFGVPSAAPVRRRMPARAFTDVVHGHAFVVGGALHHFLHPLHAFSAAHALDLPTSFRAQESILAFNRKDVLWCLGEMFRAVGGSVWSEGWHESLHGVVVRQSQMMLQRHCR